MRDYRAARAEKGVLSTMLLVWHGGEPLALPPAYVDEVLAAQDQAFTAKERTDGVIENAVLTNLFKPNATLERMIAAGFFFNVSYDGAAGPRVDGAGRDSDAAVRGNIQTLIRRGAQVGVSIVLGRHNKDRLNEIHDDIAAMGAAWLRINPMFAPPATAPGGGFALGLDEISDAFTRLIEHRAAASATLDVAPLDRAQRTAARWRDGEAAITATRAEFGEFRLVVHPNGVLATHPGPMAPERVLGDLSRQTMSEIMASKAYQESLAHDQAKRDLHCSQCRYADACTGLPLAESPLNDHAAPCEVEPRLCDAYVRLTS